MKRNTRIVVINDFSSPTGGAEKMAILNAISMAKRELDVVFISGDVNTNKDMLDLNIHCVSIGHRGIDADNPHLSLLSGLFNNKSFKVVSDWIKINDNPNTVYHLHGWNKILSPSIFNAVKNVSDRLFIHAHDYFLACPNGAFINYQKKGSCDLEPLSVNCLSTHCDQRSYLHKSWRSARGLILEKLITKLIPNANLILLQEDMRSYFLKSKTLRAAQAILLGNPITPFSYSRIKAEENDTFVFIGRLVPEKGVETFLEATRKANVKARVIGNGPELERLIDQHPEAEFVGWQEAKDIRKFLVDARAALLPSKMREVFPLATFECISSGLPCLISHTSGVAKQVKSFNFGICIDPFNVDQIVEQIHKLNASKKSIETMSRNGFENWNEVALSENEWVESLLDLYQKVL